MFPPSKALTKTMDNLLKNNTDGLQKSTNDDQVFLEMMMPEIQSPQSLLVTLEQPDGSTQVIRLTEAEAEALGLKLSYPNEATVEANEEIVKEVERPLGSSENPIQILREGDTIHSNQNLTKTHLEMIANALQTENGKAQNEDESKATNYVYRVVYPEEFNLKPIVNKTEKRGRPKKRPVVSEEKEAVVEKRPLVSARTRSGRITRPPRHIEKDFKKIETNEYDENEEDLTTTEFTPLTTSQKENENITPDLVEPLGTNPKKRNISSQYRCPKCQKAYLGRSRMIKHLQDFPDHGPLPKHCKDNNFETWNYLVDITQKCSLGSRGKKFCDELTNLLHNLRLLARVLFKTATDKKNTVKIDNLLGSALDLSPGNYKFNENELLKDVTVFTLLQSSKFFEETYLRNSNDKNTPTPSSTNENSHKTTETVVERSEKSEHQISLHNELLSDNSLLNSLPNLRNSVEELILSDVGGNLLDNSAGSDEVMNVDQFVNERFKNITEPEMEVNNSALNLDLQGLDLFNFHTS